jgi:hypothetical protein
MSFTPVLAFIESIDVDGSPSSGTASLTLTDTINDGVSVFRPDGGISAILDAAGTAAIVVPSNIGVSPAGTSYVYGLDTQGGTYDPYNVVIPNTGLGTVITGSGPPSSGTGVNGDWYMDTDAHVFYQPKTAGAWPATGTLITDPIGQTPVGVITLARLAPALPSAAMTGYVPETAVGAPNGVASLDGSGNVPLDELGNAPGSSGLPLPSGTPDVGQIPAVTQVSPLELGWQDSSDGAVESVNGQTGVVVLDAADVGADASGLAADAESAAIASAASDATSKANAAEAAAISAAATDATTKSNAAQAAAEAASDTVGSADAVQTNLDSEAVARAAADDLLIPLTEKGVAFGVPTLDSSGLIPAAQLPSLVTTDTFIIASQAAMLALSANKGDIAIRTDLTPNASFILAATPASTLANWKELGLVTDAVASVNGRTGAVTGLAEGTDLTAETNARTSGDSTNATAIAAEAATARANEALLAPLASPALTGSPTAPTATPLDASTKLSTTAYADAAVLVEKGRAQTAENLKAPLASPALTGTPTAPTQTTGDNTTAIATDAFVQTAAGLLVPKSLGTAKGDLIGFSAANTPARLPVGADTTVLTADSSQTLGVKWAAPVSAPSAMFPVPAVGQALFSQFCGGNIFGGNGPAALGDMYAQPVLIPATHTYVGLTLKVWTGGSSGSTVRVGIYSDNGSGSPGALLLDAGTLVATSAAIVTKTISQALTGGSLVWLVAVPQSSSGALPVFTAFNFTAGQQSGPMFNVGMLNSSLNPMLAGTSIMYWFVSGATGALPSTPTWTTASGSSNSRLICLGLVA